MLTITKIKLATSAAKFAPLFGNAQIAVLYSNANLASLSDSALLEALFATSRTMGEAL